MAQFDRPWRIYVVPFSHTDVGYTDSVPAVIEAHNRYLDTVIAFVNRTATNPEGERFKWTIEIPWVLESYIATRGPARAEELMSLARAGSIEIGAMHFSLQTDLCGNEELIRSLSFSDELRHTYLIPVRTAIQNDTPGFTWSLAQLLARSGIPYLSVAMNSSLAESLYATTQLPYLFFLEGQDGSRTLVWRCIDSLWAYLEGGISHGVYGSYAVMESRISLLLNRLAARGYPYDAVLINCATGDNGAPNMQIVDNVRQWNQAHPDTRMIVSTFSEFFDDVSSGYSASIPIFSGDAPNWWSWFFAPSATAGYALSRLAQGQLPAAEVLATIASAVNPATSYPAAQLTDAYVNNLYFEDHNLGAISPTGNIPFWTRKIGWVSVAADTAQAVLSRSVDALARDISTGLTPVVGVFNPTGWERSEIVRLPLSDPILSMVGSFDLLEVSSLTPVIVQRLSDGTIAFQADHIPPAGYRLFRIVARTDPVPPPLPVLAMTLENGYYRVEVDGQRGSAASIFDKQAGREVTGADGRFKLWTKNSTMTAYGLSVVSSDSGPVLQSLTLRGSAPGTNGYETSFILPAGLKRVEFVDRYDKLPATTLESTDYFFSTGISNPRLRYEIPFGHVALFDDELSGFRVKHYAAGRWLNISSAGDLFNLTLALDNAPITALPSGFSGTLRQLVAFNNANTAYRAGTGPIRMKFAATTDTTVPDPARAMRFAHGFSAPLPVRVLPAAQEGVLPDTVWSLVRSSSSDILLTTMKKPVRGSGIILRFFNPTSRSVSTVLEFSVPAISAFETTLLEEDLSALTPVGRSLPMDLGPFQVKTIRVLLNPIDGIFPVSERPSGFALEQNYPNPFNPSTIIRYSAGEAGRVTLRIFNILGQHVRTLVDGEENAGQHQVEWDGRNDNGSLLATGVYMYRLHVTGRVGRSFTKTRIMVLVR